MMSIKEVLIVLAILVLLGMVGIAINHVHWPSVFVFCLVVGISLYLFTNYWKITHLLQHEKRTELIEMYGFYITRNTSGVCVYHAHAKCPLLSHEKCKLLTHQTYIYPSIKDINLSHNSTLCYCAKIDVSFNEALSEHAKGDSK